ncbi:hypothetical protein [Nocardia pneumoniae]|uniref:hypothetical protein n=1 Tax=Nocardia pneumoniae TaxID=228601 RepID=UPI0002E24319|nr:hypothetical protein [Nocardia pneumoniae]
MERTIENELYRDFGLWTELVDRAAHAENEVEREIPALRSAELKQKWISTAGELWRSLHELYERWYETVDRLQAETKSVAYGDVDNSRQCA